MFSCRHGAVLLDAVGHGVIVPMGFGKNASDLCLESVDLSMDYYWDMPSGPIKLHVKNFFDVPAP